MFEKEFPSSIYKSLKFVFASQNFFCIFFLSAYFSSSFFYVTRFFISSHLIFQNYFYICLTVNRGIHHFDKLWELTIHLITSGGSTFGRRFKRGFFLLFKWAEENQKSSQFLVNPTINVEKLPFHSLTRSLVCIIPFSLFTHVFILLFSKSDKIFSTPSLLPTFLLLWSTIFRVYAWKNGKKFFFLLFALSLGESSRELVFICLLIS
jgi:hypothetical protein